MLLKLFSPFQNAGDYSAEKTSVRTLSEEEGISGEELLTGGRSLGAMLEGRGFNAIPSPRQPAPGEDSYFDGGYITQVT